MIRAFIGDWSGSGRCHPTICCIFLCVNSPGVRGFVAKMYKGLSWDDLCLVHAIDEAGTLSGAASALNVSHPTISRKLNALERKLDVLLFDRDQRRYSATASGGELINLFLRLKGEVDVVERRLTGRDLRPSGTIRFTTTDTLLHGRLAPILAEFRENYEDIKLEVVVSNDVLSLSKREADIALRPMAQPIGFLASKHLGSIEQAVYGARFKHTDRDTPLDLHGQDWIGPDSSISYPVLQKWMRSNAFDATCIYRSNSILDMFAATKHGIGISVLPCYLADDDPALVRLSNPVQDLAVNLWIITHPDLRKAERIRIFWNFIVSRIGEPTAHGKRIISSVVN